MSEDEEGEEVTEATLIAGFIKWAQMNRIPLYAFSYSEIYEYICRYLKAAG